MLLQQFFFHMDRTKNFKSWWRNEYLLQEHQCTSTYRPNFFYLFIVFCCIMLFIATNLGWNKITNVITYTIHSYYLTARSFLWPTVYILSRQFWATTVHYVHHAVITMVISQFSAFMWYVVAFHVGSCQICLILTARLSINGHVWFL